MANPNRSRLGFALAIVLLLCLWPDFQKPAAGEGLCPAEPPLETQTKLLIGRLDLHPGLVGLDDAGFSELLERNLTFLFETGTDQQKPETDQVSAYAVAALAACHWERWSIARECLLQARRRATSPAEHEWIYTFLHQLARNKLLRAGSLGRRPYLEPLPGPEFQVFLQRALAGEQVLYSETPDAAVASLRSRTGLMLGNTAMSSMEDGRPGMARSLVWRAAQAYFAHSSDLGQKLGGMIWESRRLRDLGRSFGALVLLRQANLLAEGQNSSYWQAILAEDLGDLWQALGRPDQAWAAFQVAQGLFRAMNSSSADRVGRKIDALPQE